MKFSQLQNLIAVSESRSVRQAAFRLNLSQPAVSKSIKQLEESVGAQLLNRGPHGVVPTPSGEALILRARVICSEMGRARDEIAFLEGARGGKISIGVTQTVTTNILPRAVLRFSARRPQVRIYIEEDNVSEVVDAVRNGSFDFAICFLPSDADDRDLRIETLMAESFTPAVRTGHPLAKRRRLQLKNLLADNWVIFGRGDGRRMVYEETFRRTGLNPPESAIESNSIGCTVSIIESSDRIALLPSQILTTERIGRTITPLHIAGDPPEWRIALVMRAGGVLPTVCLELIDHIHAVIAERSPN